MSDILIVTEITIHLIHYITITTITIFEKYTIKLKRSAYYQCFFELPFALKPHLLRGFYRQGGIKFVSSLTLEV